MTALFAILFILILVTLISLHFLTRLRRLSVADVNCAILPLPPAARYRPMLRLLSTNDQALVASNKPLARKLKKQRTEIFREYLSCLSVDYGRLLAGLRHAMAMSDVERPDLAMALAKNRLLFTLALCRIEYRLYLHTFGLGTVDVSGLVEAIGSLTSQVSLVTPSMASAR